MIAQPALKSRENLPKNSNTKIEKRFLGASIKYPETYDDLKETLNGLPDEIFSDPRHQKIFQGYRSIISEGKFPETLKISGWLEARGLHYDPIILEIVNDVFSNAYAKQDLNEIISLYKKRKKTIELENLISQSESLDDEEFTRIARQIICEPIEKISVTAGEWPKPQLKPKPDIPVPNLPEDFIPDPLRAWIIDTAERICIPKEYITAPVIVELGSLIGRQVGIYPKRHDDWLVVPNLWGAIVGSPALLKSPAIQTSMKPMNILAKRAGDAFKEAKNENESSHSILELRIEAIKKAIAGKLKNGNSITDLELELTGLIAESKNSKLFERRYHIQDSTIEKLAVLLNENPHGILLIRDELAGWLQTLDRLGHEGDREFFLESWNGAGRYSVDRIGRGTLHVEALTLSIFGTIQPGKLSSYINGALEQGKFADGLLQRFQIIVWPDELGEWKNVDRWPNSEAKTTAYKIFEGINELDLEKIGAKVVEGEEIPSIRFSESAQGLFDEWRDTLEKRLRSAELEKYPAFASHIGKYRSLMPSLALIFHIIEVLSRDFVGFDGSGVSLNSAKLAAKWVDDFLEKHASAYLQ